MPPRQTKQDIIDELEEQVGEQLRQKGELEEQLHESVRLNDRLNSTIKKGREKIGSLKDVARFYRAQRDRIDAYLSAVLDTAEKQNSRGFGEMDVVPTQELHDVVRRAENTLKRDDAAQRTRRPRVQEPMGMSGNRHLDLSDGRDYAAYRDQEPEQNWEDF